MKECRICNKPNSEEHHIVFKSQAPYMKNCKINKIFLCSNDHRGEDGPHKNVLVDMKYKLQLQEELFKIFNKKNYKYSKENIKELLGISNSAVLSLCKNINKNKKGYNRIDIIKACMGGKIYSWKEFNIINSFIERYMFWEKQLKDNKVQAIIVKPRVMNKKRKSSVCIADFLILNKDGTYKIEKSSEY